MSTTVAELYDQLKHWIGEEPDALYLVNTAIRYIAKRLYILGSEMVIGVMEVPVFEADTITGSDIAFVDGGATADTITQVAAGFVAAGFQAGMPIYTDSTVNPGPFRIASVAAGTITLHDDDSVTDEAAGTAITITSDDSYGFLPDDFWGLWDEPYFLPPNAFQLLEDFNLSPVPSTTVEISYISPATPHYYKIRGNLIYLTPHVNRDIVVKADYFQKPTTLTSISDELPWNDIYNDVIYEICINLFKKSGVIIKEVQALMNTAIDLVAMKRGRKAPHRAPRGILYEDYA
jgi:hypothetical protein